MPTVFSNPPRKGQPARIWHLDRVHGLAAELPLFPMPLGCLMDGFHRLARAYLDRRESIPAVQFSEDPPPDRLSTWHEWHEATLRE